MRAGDAREVAAAWLREEWLPWAASDGKAEGFKGAYVMGSLATADDDADFDTAASDLDIAIVVDTDVLPVDAKRYPHGKFLVFQGCVVQAIFVPLGALGDRDRLLSMLGLGCNLRNARFLADPEGRLETARELVAQEWAGQPWLSQRTERAITFAEKAVQQLTAAESPLQQLDALTDVVSQLGGLVAIACGVTPTHRRSVAVAAKLLEPRGRTDLAERLLAALGAEDIDPTTIEAATADAIASTQVEQRYAASSPMPAELIAVLPKIASGGIQQMVRQGETAAAMLPALQVIAMGAGLTGGHANEADRELLDELVRRALQRAGIPPQSWEQRCAQLRQLTDDVVAFCRTTAAA